MRPLFFSKETKQTFDKGTPNEQTVTYPPKVTYLEIWITEFGWFLSRLFGIEERCYHMSPCNHKKIVEPGYQYAGTGFYMSMKGAQRLRWIWRGRSIYSLFWGSRTRNHVNFELRDDRIGPNW